jgi:hypothetical protein
MAGMCLLVFAPNKHGDRMWHDFATHPVNSPGFIVPLFILLGCSALMVLVSWRYVVMAYPSDETFYCDRSTLTVAKVRWLDAHNRDWWTRSYPLGSISGIKYKVLATTKGSAVYGLRFKAEGRIERVLPGLGTRDAGRILRAVKAFGVDVKH